MLLRNRHVLFAVGLLGLGLGGPAWAGEPPSPARLAEALDKMEQVPELKAWIETWRTVLPDARFSEFVTAYSQPFPSEHAHRFVLQEGSDPRKALRWAGVVVLSPDGAWAVGCNLWKAEPDSAAYLANLKTGETVRVHSCGTGCEYQIVAWLDTERFVIAGTDTDMTWRLALDLFDLESWTLTRLQGQRFTRTHSRVKPVWLQWLKEHFPESHWPEKD